MLSPAFSSGVKNELRLEKNVLAGWPVCDWVADLLQVQVVQVRVVLGRAVAAQGGEAREELLKGLEPLTSSLPRTCSTN
jgi:hypothetical protein